MKRGVELGLNTVILIVLGLIVLGLVSYVVVKYIIMGGDEIGSCANNNGRCDSSCNPGEKQSGFFVGGCADGEVCCIRPDYTTDT